MTPIQKIFAAITACIAAATTVTLVALSLQTEAVVVPTQWHICGGTPYYTLQAQQNNSYVLDIKNGYLPNGANVQMWQWVGGMNQVWFFDPIDDNILDILDTTVIMIRTLLNGKCLDHSNSTLHMWDCQTNNPNQQWYWQACGQIMHITGPCLVPNGTSSDGLTLQLVTCSGKNTWQLSLRN